VIKATVVDISPAGAKLTGHFSTRVEPGLTLGPLTFALYRRFAPKEVTDIIVPEANVVWAEAGASEVERFGVRFDPEFAAADKLTDYLSSRRLEVQAEQGKGKA